MQCLNGPLLSGLDAGQGVLNGLDLPQLALEFLQICGLPFLNTRFPADHRHTLSRLPAVIVLLSLPQVLDPAKHPVFPDRQEADLLEEKLLFVRRYCVRQAPLLWLQAIKKESLKLSRRNCILISRWPGAAVTDRVFIARLAAALFRCTTFL